MCVFIFVCLSVNFAKVIAFVATLKFGFNLVDIVSGLGMINVCCVVIVVLYVK